MGGRRSLRWRSCGLPNPALDRTAQPRCCGVPSALRGGELELHLVHVLNVNPLGARLVPLELWHAGVVCHVDLPFALEALRLTGRVVWTRLHGTEQTVDGERRCYDDSGIEFTGLTPEQQTAGVPSPLPPHVTGVP